jgi:2'-5' RNA ligase
MRLFIAFDLNDHARLAIAAEQERLGAALAASRESSIRWVRPEQMHVTLVFLGEVDDERADALAADIGSDVAHPPFEIVFNGTGVFPPRGAPKVLWIGVTAGAEAAIAVQTELTQRVARHGVPLETRPFQPHLTIGRWRESRPADRERILKAAGGGSISVPLDHATLYRSRLSPAGPSYMELARARLCLP